MQEFDLIVIGSGPAGYTGAIRAAQLGMKVACIEKNSVLGGTCLNVGCIPSKLLLNFSKKYHEATHNFSDLGIITETKLDLKKMMAKKKQVVSDLNKGIEGLFAKNKVSKFNGTCSFISNNIVAINNGSQTEQITAKNILIATGSSVITLPNITIDEEHIISSTGALSLNRVPKNMVVIGGGYIGLELGSVWSRLGSKVTIIEYADTIVPALDKEIISQFTKIIQKQGIELRLNTKLVSATKKADKVILQIEEQKNTIPIPTEIAPGSHKAYEGRDERGATTHKSSGDGYRQELTVDVVLFAIGRKANTENLTLDKIGIPVDKHGRITVNNKFQTAIPHIYAIGDVIAGPMLAHKAEEEAIAAVEIMANKAGHVNYHLIPSVIYTSPEVACVGYTEEQLKEKNINYKVGKFPFLANSRARTIGLTEGMVKLLADSTTDKILGAHIIGPEAGTMIAEVVAFMEFGASSEDIARTCHAHPTLNEAIKEAALAVDKRTINF